MHYIRSPTRYPKELPQQNKRQERSVDRQTTCTAAIPPSDLQGASSPSPLPRLRPAAGGKTKPRAELRRLPGQPRGGGGGGGRSPRADPSLSRAPPGRHKRRAPGPPPAAAPRLLAEVAAQPRETKKKKKKTKKPAQNRQHREEPADHRRCRGDENGRQPRRSRAGPGRPPQPARRRHQALPAAAERRPAASPPPSRPLPAGPRPPARPQAERSPSAPPHVPARKSSRLPAKAPHRHGRGGAPRGLEMTPTSGAVCVTRTCEAEAPPLGGKPFPRTRKSGIASYACDAAGDHAPFGFSPALRMRCP